MSETTLDQLRIRERDMELEAITLRARVEELRRIIELLEHAEHNAPRRQRRNVNVSVVNDPMRVSGGVAETPTGMPWDDEETAA